METKQTKIPTNFDSYFSIAVLSWLIRLIRNIIAIPLLAVHITIAILASIFTSLSMVTTHALNSLKDFIPTPAESVEKAKMDKLLDAKLREEFPDQFKT